MIESTCGLMTLKIYQALSRFSLRFNGQENSPPSKVAPRIVHSRIIGPPGPNIATIPGPPLLPTVPPAANFFHNCLCHGTCIWRTAWTLPVRLKQNEATSAKSLQEGQMTPLPLKKNRHNGC